MRALLVAMVIALSVTSIQGWWCNGHMVIAQLAWNNLDAGIQTEISKIFTSLSQSGPFPQSPDMVQGACWADDLKSEKLYPMASWHFINTPYIQPADYKPPKTPVVQDENVASVITQLEGTGKAEKWDHVQWIQNFAIANLVHFFGDIHQPLHATTLYSPQFPTGDEGGNLYHVNIDGTETHLHFIWDSVCWQWTERFNRPLNAANLTFIQKMAKMIEATQNVSVTNKTVYNSTIMAEESFVDAKEYAYGGAPAPGGNITQQYIDRCIPVAHRRLALAGWRLHSELAFLFKDFASHKSHAEINRRAAKRLRELQLERLHARFGKKKN